jgi:hypothetical protein
VSARYLLTDTVALVAMTGATLSLGLLWYRPVVAGVDEASGRSTASTPPGPLRPPTDRGRSGPARVRRRPPGGTG